MGNHPIIKNLIFIFITMIVLVAILLYWLNIYTQHGKSVTVPNVQRLSVQDAAPILAHNHLRYEIIDSIYVSGAAPGSILEQIPQEGLKVKEGRTIFLTINATSARKISIPDVKDMSLRQASALLIAQGFPEPDIQYVSSEYKDLVLGVSLNGKNMERGAKLSADTHLTLLVGDGYAVSPADSLLNDSLSTQTEEGWLE